MKIGIDASNIIAIDEGRAAFSPKSDSDIIVAKAKFFKEAKRA